MDKVIAQFGAPTISLGFGGSPFGCRKVLRDTVELTGARGPALKKAAMNKEIGIAPDRRGEVSIIILRQSEMTLRSCCVAGPRESAEKSNLEGGPCGRSVQMGHHFLDFSV